MRVNVLNVEGKKSAEWENISSLLLLFYAFYFDRFKRYIHMWTFSSNNFTAEKGREREKVKGVSVLMVNAKAVTLRV